jgi:hypothetical protein
VANAAAIAAAAINSAGLAVNATTGSIQAAASIGSTTYPLAMRNMLHNGDFRIDQRYAGNAQTPATGTGWAADRWYYSNSQTSKITYQAQIGVMPAAGQTGGGGYLICTCAAAVASPAAGDSWSVWQAIEAGNCTVGWGTANAQPVSLSFWVYATQTGTWSGSLQNAANTRSYPFTFTVNTTLTWQYITIPNIPGDTAGTWNMAGTNTGIRVIFSLGGGTTLFGTAGSWSSNNYVGATGTNNLLATLGNVFEVTAVQLERGPICTAYEQRPLSMELQLCQRYAYFWSNLGLNGCYFAFGGILNTSTGNMNGIFPVPMRSNPTGPTFTQGAVGNFTLANSGTGTTAACTSFSSNGTNLMSGVFSAVTGSASFTASQACEVYTNTTTLTIVGWSADIN